MRNQLMWGAQTTQRSRNYDGVGRNRAPAWRKHKGTKREWQLRRRDGKKKKKTLQEQKGEPTGNGGT